MNYILLLTNKPV